MMEIPSVFVGTGLRYRRPPRRAGASSGVAGHIGTEEDSAIDVVTNSHAEGSSAGIFSIGQRREVHYATVPARYGLTCTSLPALINMIPVSSFPAPQGASASRTWPPGLRHRCESPEYGDFLGSTMNRPRGEHPPAAAGLNQGGGNLPPLDGLLLRGKSLSRLFVEYLDILAVRRFSAPGDHGEGLAVGRNRIRGVLGDRALDVKDAHQHM